MKRLLTFCVWCLMIAGFLSFGQGNPVPMNVVVITSDTTRSASVSAYGDPISRMPNLDRLVRSGTQIRWPISVATCTLPAHTSVFTGQFPDQHGVVGNESFLPENTLTLARILRRQGYDTACFCSVSILADLASDFEQKYLPENFWRRSGTFVDQVCEYLRDHRGGSKPFLLWVHGFDPHHPYAPPEPYQSLFPEVAQGQPFVNYEAQEKVPMGYCPELPRASTLAQYYGALQYWDHNLGLILSEVSKIPNTLLIFVADHGENLGEGGIFGHVTGTEPVLQIPLVFYHTDKKVVPANFIVDGVAQQTDLVPTILAALDIAYPVSFEGQNLLSVIQKKSPAGQRQAYSLSGFWAYLSDPRSDLKFRRRLLCSHPDFGTRDYQSLKPFFEDNIIDDGILEWQTLDSGTENKYAGRVKIPAVKYVEGIDLGFGIGETFLSLSEFAVDRTGHFSASYSLDLDESFNFWHRFGEAVPYEFSNLGTQVYALRFLDQDRQLIWQSPWIEFDNSLYQAPDPELTERFIDTAMAQEIEIGIDATGHPDRHRLAAELDRLLHRPGGMLNRLNNRLDLKGATVLAGLSAVNPEQAYAAIKENQLKSGSIDPKQIEALQSLGYLN